MYLSQVSGAITAYYFGAYWHQSVLHVLVYKHVVQAIKEVAFSSNSITQVLVWK